MVCMLCRGYAGCQLSGWCWMWAVCCYFFRGVLLLFFFFKQKTAYEMRISDWSSDVCSSDLGLQPCNQILLEFSERRHDPLIAMARHCIQYMTHKPRRRLGLWRQTIAEAFGKQARWTLGDRKSVG